MNPRRLLYILVATLLTLAVTDFAPQIFASAETEAAASSSAHQERNRNTSRKSPERNPVTVRGTRNVHPPVASLQTRGEDPKRAASERLADTAGQQSPALDWIPANLNPGGLRVNSVKPEGDRGRYAVVNLNEHFTYLP